MYLKEFRILGHGQIRFVRMLLFFIYYFKLGRWLKDFSHDGYQSRSLLYIKSWHTYFLYFKFEIIKIKFLFNDTKFYMKRIKLKFNIIF